MAGAPFPSSSSTLAAASAVPLAWIGPVTRAAIVKEAGELAERLRAERSERVGAPGEKAICAVLLMRQFPELSMRDAQRIFGAYPQAIRKYRALLDQLAAGTSIAANQQPCRSTVCRWPAAAHTSPEAQAAECLAAWFGSRISWLQLVSRYAGSYVAQSASSSDVDLHWRAPRMLLEVDV